MAYLQVVDCHVVCEAKTSFRLLNLKVKVNKVLGTKILPAKSSSNLNGDTNTFDEKKKNLVIPITRKEKIQLFALASSAWTKKRIMSVDIL